MCREFGGCWFVWVKCMMIVDKKFNVRFIILVVKLSMIGSIFVIKMFVIRKVLMMGEVFVVGKGVF